MPIILSSIYVCVFNNYSKNLMSKKMRENTIYIIRLNM